MHGWLRVSGAIDQVNELLGRFANLLVLLSCLVSAGNAMVRYAYDLSSNGWLEAQWYMFAAMVMFGASYTLRRNEHVRVEIFYLYLTERGQLWLDLVGAIVFLIPVLPAARGTVLAVLRAVLRGGRVVGQRRRSRALADQAGAAGGLRADRCCRACPRSSSASPRCRATC